MKPSMHDVYEDEKRRTDMMADHSDGIGRAIQYLWNDLPAIPKPDSITYLKLVHDCLMTFKDMLEEEAEPYIDDLASEQANASDVDAQIHEGKLNE